MHTFPYLFPLASPSLPPSLSHQNQLHAALPCSKHQHQPELPLLRSGSLPHRVPLASSEMTAWSELHQLLRHLNFSSSGALLQAPEL